MKAGFFSFKASSKLHIIGSLLFALIFILIFAAHVYKLDSIPPGLFFDESSIGYEAAAIIQTGLNEQGWRIPIFFRSAWDYDSPILIYATALVFRMFGISEYTLRLTNALFFTAALLLTVWLAIGIFKENWLVWIYALIAFGFLPLFFTISRLSFEVISQLACVAAICLSVWWTFHQDDSKDHGTIKASVCGLMIGISAYTYSTANLLSALMLVSLWVVYFNREHIKKLLTISVVCLISLIPYAVFTLTNPDALTSRFRGISYLYDPIPLLEKVGIFLSNYFTYWSPGFLILRGDMNIRHSTGQGGIVYIAVLILFSAGLIGILRRRNPDKFKLFLLLNLLISPIAAALTSEGTPHALRSLLLGYYILLISCYGLNNLLGMDPSWVRISALVGISILLLYEVIQYQFDYFILYPARSVDAMGSYDFKGSLEFAIDENPGEIILFDNFPGLHENLQFYRQVVNNPDNISIRAEPTATPAPGVCIIYRRVSGAEEELEPYSLPYTEFRSRKQPTAFEKQFGAKAFAGVMKVRCYGGTE